MFASHLDAGHFGIDPTDAFDVEPTGEPVLAGDPSPSAISSIRVVTAFVDAVAFVNRLLHSPAGLELITDFISELFAQLEPAKEKRRDSEDEEKRNRRRDDARALAHDLLNGPSYRLLIYLCRSGRRGANLLNRDLNLVIAFNPRDRSPLSGSDFTLNFKFPLVCLNEQWFTPFLQMQQHSAEWSFAIFVTLLHEFAHCITPFVAAIHFAGDSYPQFQRLCAEGKNLKSAIPDMKRFVLTWSPWTLMGKEGAAVPGVLEHKYDEVSWQLSVPESGHRLVGLLFGAPIIIRFQVFRDAVARPSGVECSFHLHLPSIPRIRGVDYERDHIITISDADEQHADEGHEIAVDYLSKVAEWFRRGPAVASRWTRCVEWMRCRPIPPSFAGSAPYLRSLADLKAALQTSLRLTDPPAPFLTDMVCK